MEDSLANINMSYFASAKYIPLYTPLFTQLYSMFPGWVSSLPHIGTLVETYSYPAPSWSGEMPLFPRHLVTPGYRFLKLLWGSYTLNTWHPPCSGRDTTESLSLNESLVRLSVSQARDPLPIGQLRAYEKSNWGMGSLAVGGVRVEDNAF